MLRAVAFLDSARTGLRRERHLAVAIFQPRVLNLFIYFLVGLMLR